MKTWSTFIGTILLCTTCTVAFGQNDGKPHQHTKDGLPIMREMDATSPAYFAKLPQKATANSKQLATLFLAADATNAKQQSFVLIPEMGISGKLKSSYQPHPTITYLEFDVAEMPGAKMALSKVTEPNGNVIYNGMLRKPGSGDVIVLEGSSAADLSWQKKRTPQVFTQ